MRNILILCAAVTVIVAPACKREQRNPRPLPSESTVLGTAARESDIEPGGKRSHPPTITNPYNGNAQAISEGQQLFQQYNCSGCHANGGGGMGPALMDNVWIYGGEPANIFDTIVKGRPNGMPSWGGRIPQDQIWKIVAYVRSLSGQEPKSATPARTDTLEQNPMDIQNKVRGQTR